MANGFSKNPDSPELKQLKRQAKKILREFPKNKRRSYLISRINKASSDRALFSMVRCTEYWEALKELFPEDTSSV